jgi:hypothetical protein
MIDDPLNRLKVARGEDLPQSKLTEADVRAIRAKLERRNQLLEEAKTLTNDAIAREFGVCRSSINKIAMGYTWSHI